MPRKFSEKYILNLSESRSFKDIGKEGFERKKILEAKLKSPRMLFVLESAFRDYISHLGYKKELIKGFGFDEIQELSSEIFQRDLPLEMQEEIESEYRSWKMSEKEILVEIRLSNKDFKQNYIEKVKPLVINDFEHLIIEIKKCWLSALEDYKEGVIVQITEIPVYDVSGFVYVNRDSQTLEINVLYGLWINGGKIDHYDVCMVDLQTLEITNYTIGNQETMLVKSGKEVVEIPVAESWRKSYKMTQPQIKNLIKKSKDVSELLNKSIEFSFGVQKNDIYVHDLRDFKTEYFSENYVFSEDFFGNNSSESFQNEVEAIANIELPFFLREDISVIESNIEKSSQKNLIATRLKKDLGILRRSSTTEYLKIDHLNELFHMESNFEGFMIEFEIFLKTINNLEKSSPEKIHSILLQSISSIENYFKSLSGVKKEVVLKLSKLGNRLEENKNPHYFAKTLDLIPLRKLGLEILIFKRLLEENSFENLSLSLPPLRSFEEMEFVLNILDLSEFKGIKNNNAKLYVDLSIPSMLFEYSKDDLPKKYLLDGVVIDINEFMGSFFDKKTFTDRDYKIAVEYLVQNLDSMKNNISQLMLVLRDIPQKDEITKLLSPSLVIVDPE